jgi:hypothetical protein
MEFHLAAQLQWLSMRRDAIGTPASDVALFFRRVRPVIKGHLLGEELTYLLHISTLPGSLELMDLWADYRFGELLGARVGQMKVPFTRWRMNSYMVRPSIDWSYGSRYFGAERQLGVMLYNGALGRDGFEAQAGLFDGVNARGVHGTGTALVYKETTPNPSDLTGPGRQEDLRAEAVVHVAYNAGGIDVTRPTDFNRGPFRWSAGLSAAWDLDPTPRRDMLLRLAPEVEAKWEGFAATGVFYLGYFEPVSRGGVDLGLVGGLLQTSYMVTEMFEVALKVTSLQILGSLRRDARAVAAEIIAASGGAATVVAQYGAAGDLRSEQEVNLTFNLFVVGGAIKLQLEGIWLLHEERAANRSDFGLRAQAQLAF